MNLRGRGIGGRLAALVAPVLLCPLCAPAAAAERETYFSPSFSAAAIFDDNIFFRSRSEDRQGGRAARFGPALHAGWQPVRSLSVTAAYALDSDYYPDYPELNRLIARQRASLALRYRLGPRGSLHASAGYEQSQTGSNLIEDSGLELGRRPGHSYSAGLGLDRRVGRGGSLGLDYRFGFYEFDGDLGRGSHSALVGWTQQFGGSTTASVRAGPRFTDDVVSADVSGSLSRRFRRSVWSIGYSRARYVTPGLATDSESLAGTVTRRLGRSTQLSVSPALFRHWRADDERRGYRGSVSLVRRLNRRLFGHAGFHHIRQQALEVRPETGGSPDWARRNLFLIGLTAVGSRRGAPAAAGTW